MRLIPAQFVKPYRKSNKNDFIDAETIAEAVTKQKMRFVQIRIKYDSRAFGQWVHRLAQRAPATKVVVEFANKLARIGCAVLSSGKDYRHQPLQPQPFPRPSSAGV